MRALAAYVGGLTLAGGDRDGMAFEVLSWERRFLSGAFRQPGDAALSVARGNGKSALLAAVACAVVDPEGPLHGRRREVVCVAASFEQARVIFEDVREFLAERFDLDDPPGVAQAGLGQPGRTWSTGPRALGCAASARTRPTPTGCAPPSCSQTSPPSGPRRPPTGWWPRSARGSARPPAPG